MLNAQSVRSNRLFQYPHTLIHSQTHTHTHTHFHTGLMLCGANVVGIPTTYIMQVLLEDGKEKPWGTSKYSPWLASNLFMISFIAASSFLLFVYQGEYKRMKADEAGRVVCEGGGGGGGGGGVGGGGGGGGGGDDGGEGGGAVGNSSSSSSSSSYLAVKSGSISSTGSAGLETSLQEPLVSPSSYSS